MIPDQKIREIIDTARIEEVIGDFVTLKKAGINFKALSPFANEKTPSFVVSPVKQIFKDFSSGLGGNVVTFVMEHEGMSFIEAIRWLAQKYNIELEEIEYSDEAIESKKKTDSLYIINQFAQKHYSHTLAESEEGRAIGLSYLKERGFTQKTIDSFQLGYAPKGATLLKSALKKGYKEELLKELGLVNNYKQDFFRERVIFPIHSIADKTIGFGGRIMSGEKKIAKYINSPESEIYNKSKVLYGAYQAKKSIRVNDNCILVEGYTDVISLHQNGIENVVASSGTALTIEQIRLIKRYTENITILYDGDAAGIKAATRGIELVLTEGLNVKICILPNKEDPDSYVRNNGASSLSNHLEKESKDFILFKTSLLLDEAKNDPIKKATLIKEIIQTIAKISDPIKRSVYIKECANRFETKESLINSEINKLIRVDIAKTENNQRKSTSAPAAPTEEELMIAEAAASKEDTIKPTQKTKGSPQEIDILRILILFGDKDYNTEGMKIAHYVFSNIMDVFDEIKTQHIKTIITTIYNDIADNKFLSFNDYCNHSDSDIRTLAVQFIGNDFEYSYNWNEKLNYPLQSQKPPEENYVKDAESSVKRFRLTKIEQLERVNQEKLKEAQKYGNTEDLIKILKVQMEIQKLRKAITDDLGMEGAK